MLADDLPAPSPISPNTVSCAGRWTSFAKRQPKKTAISRGRQRGEWPASQNSRLSKARHRLRSNYERVSRSNARAIGAFRHCRDHNCVLVLNNRVTPMVGVKFCIAPKALTMLNHRGSVSKKAKLPQTSKSASSRQSLSRML
jgi:hypothetical protein